MPEQMTWLALRYTVPINPSRSRVYVWRKLKEFGAEYLKQGLAVLPYHNNSVAQFTALSDKIREFGGACSMMEIRFLDPAEDQQLIDLFRSQSKREFTQLVADCTRMWEAIKDRRGLADFEHSEEDEELRKLIRHYAKLKSRDHFQAGSGFEVDRSIKDLSNALRWPEKQADGKK